MAPKTKADATTVRLTFVGTPDQYLDGVPQADVEVSVEQATDLVASGLYAKNDKGSAPEGDPTP